MGSIKLDPPRLIEVTSLPVIYVDDMGKLIVDGSNVRITYVEHRVIGNERVRMPVLEVVRPLSSCKPERFCSMIKEAIGDVASASGGGLQRRH